MAEAKSNAEKIADGSLKAPPHVEEAVLDVNRVYNDQKIRRGAAVAIGQMTAEENDSHPLYAYRYEEVDGEIVEIRKDSDGKATLVHRPDLTPPGKVDPRAIALDPAGWQAQQRALESSDGE